MMKSIMLTFMQVLLALVLYVIGTIILGIALYPAVSFVMAIWHTTSGITMNWRILYCSLAIAGAYFIFGMTLVLVVGAVRTLLNIRLKEGDFRMGSSEMFKWYFTNALFLSVRSVFMDFIMLTPFCALFYRMMGAKLGVNVQINSKNVADHALLELGDNVVIGGNATVIGHSFEAHGLRLAKVKIGRNSIIGLNSVIMPGVTIGEGCVVAAGAIVPKGTVIEDKTIYYSPERQVKKT